MPHYITVRHSTYLPILFGIFVLGGLLCVWSSVSPLWAGVVSVLLCIYASRVYLGMVAGVGVIELSSDGAARQVERLMQQDCHVAALLAMTSLIPSRHHDKHSQPDTLPLLNKPSRRDNLVTKGISRLLIDGRQTVICRDQLSQEDLRKLYFWQANQR